MRKRSWWPPPSNNSAHACTAPDLKAWFCAVLPKVTWLRVRHMTGLQYYCVWGLCSPASRSRQAKDLFLPVVQQWCSGIPGLAQQIWDLGRCTALLWVQPWQVAQKPGHHLSPHVPRPHGRWAQSWAALSWLRAQQRSAGSELPPFVLEADMEKTPKAQSPSQFHHKYPDRVSGAELIVKALAAALPETALPAVGGRRLGQEAPRCTRGLCRPALTPSCRHVEGGLLGFGRCCSVHQPVTRLGQ
ncbi:hypothetical protein NN561_010602 [Cricetulus griseus]